MKIKPIIRGIISYIPLLNRLLKRKGTGGSSSALYCFSVWMRHLKHLEGVGLKKAPNIVAEFGPGDSLGIGLAALLSGTREYIAMDIIRHANSNRNITILNELVDLYSNGNLIPDGIGFENVNPKISNTAWPDLIDRSLFSKENLTRKHKLIKNEILGINNSAIKISYSVPWTEHKVLNNNSIDLILSQAVMEHIMDIDLAYQTMFDSLNSGGYISHQIDFKAHETSNVWSGHYGYTKFVWRIIMHGRKYEINRYPISTHLKSIEKCGFKIVKIIPVQSDPVSKTHISKKIRSNFNKQDLETSSSLIIARKE